MAANSFASLSQLQNAALRGRLDSAKRDQEILDTILPLLQELRHGGLTVTLPADAWSDRTQTITHESLLADASSWYLVCGDADNFGAWSEACINADNITEDGKMTFHCMATPTTDLVVNIIRLEVDTTDE